MIVLIGSKALSNWIKLERTALDLDVVGSYDDIISEWGKFPVIYPENKGKKLILRKDKEIVEAEIAWPDSSAKQLFDLAISDSNSEELIGGFIVPSLNFLYMLKMSHRYLKNSPHFLKTMRDIQLMRKHGAVIQPEHKEFYKLRMADTYWYKHPKLNTGKKEFFTDDVPYQYDHDDLHIAIKHLDNPAYEYYKADNEAVLCSKEKFFSVSEEVRLYGGLEEAYTLALERHQIPNDYKPSPRASFNIAIMKTCTSITSGWFREWCWEHYDAICTLYNDNYVQRFRDALARGEVKPYVK